MPYSPSTHSSISRVSSSPSSSAASQFTAMTWYSSTSQSVRSRKTYAPSPQVASPSPLRTVSVASGRPTTHSPSGAEMPLGDRLLDRLSGLQGLESMTPSWEDTQCARERIQLHRTAGGRRDRRRPTAGEATAVLDDISRGLITGTPGLVLALITIFAASVCVALRSAQGTESLRDRWRERERTEVRSRILAQAVRSCSEEVVYVLALFADAAAVGEALPVAMMEGEALKVLILMARGADASSLCEPFQRAVESGPDDLVEALLLKGGNGGPCQRCLDIGLLRAATIRNETKAALLLRKGADVAFDGGSALTAASRGGMQRLAIRMVQSTAEVGQRRRLDRTLLDRLVREAYRSGQLQLLEACLRVGAGGTMTDDVLVQAIRLRQDNLAVLLARHGADLSHEGGLAVRLAVRGRRLSVLGALLRYGGKTTLGPGVIGAAVAEAVRCPENRLVMDMMELLLAANVHHDSVNGALMLTLSVDRTTEGPSHDQHVAALAHLLITKGHADPNVNGGVCLEIAVKKGWLDTTRQLLHPRNPLRALHNTMMDVMMLSNDQCRMPLLICLTDHIERSVDADPASKKTLLATALQTASGELLPDAVDFLVSKPRLFSVVDLTTAWQAATSADRSDRWMSPDGLRVLHLLLEQRVSGECVADAFCTAVACCHREATRLLSLCVRNEVTFSRALRRLVSTSQGMTSPSSSSSWCREENLWLVGELLAGGCDGASVNGALLAAVEACIQGVGSEAIVEAILTDVDRADINFRQGEMLKLAVRAGQVLLLKLLLSRGDAQREVLTEVYTTLITTPLDEHTIISLLGVLQGDEETGHGPRFDVNMTLGQTLPPLAACLHAHPSYAELVRKLIRLGCDTEAIFQFDLFPGGDTGAELCTVLVWACLSPGERTVSGAVIDALIAGNGNINFTTTLSRSTPLLVAARCGRGDIVTRLIAAGATVNARDYTHSTALSYASRVGDLTLVYSLRDSSQPNDGSLHHAARNTHSLVVRALLAAGHDVNFPFRGRTALQELCSHGNVGHPSFRDALEDTLHALHDARCDVWIEHGGRSALFLALENQRAAAVEATGALLRVLMWEHIDHPRTVFRVATSTSSHGEGKGGNRLVYTPTVYLDSPYFRGRSQDIPELRTLLYGAQAVDRYYVEFGSGTVDFVQPWEAVNVPIHVEEGDRNRQSGQRQLDSGISHQSIFPRRVGHGREGSDVITHTGMANW